MLINTYVLKSASKI